MRVVIIIAMTLTVLFYFMFTKEHVGRRSGMLAKVARWSIMLAFGASFGNTITFRTNVLIERIMFLLHDWLGL